MVKTSPSSARSKGSITGQGAKIPHTSQLKNQNIKQKQYCNKFNVCQVISRVSNSLQPPVSSVYGILQARILE